MITEFLLFLSSMLAITWSLIFLITGIIGISIYKVSGQKMQSFMKNVKYASIWNNDEPEGWIIGKWYIGYVFKSQGSRGDTSMELFILCKQKYYNVNISKTDDEESKDTEDNTNGTPRQKLKTIAFYEREGNAYWNLIYIQRQIPCTSLIPRDYQQSIVEKIHRDYQERSYSVVLLHGEPGKGKSMVPYFLAKYMLQQEYKKISLVDTFNPSQPGGNFSTLYTKVFPSKDSPLIVVIEEIDIMIAKIHTDTVCKHRDIPTLITNKIDWNMFLDRFDRGLYQHVIFIMTTNKSDTYFDELDASYMRENRVNIKCKVGF